MKRFKSCDTEILSDIIDKGIVQSYIDCNNTTMFWDVLSEYVNTFHHNPHIIIKTCEDITDMNPPHDFVTKFLKMVYKLGFKSTLQYALYIKHVSQHGCINFMRCLCDTSEWYHKQMIRKMKRNVTCVKSIAEEYKSNVMSFFPASCLISAFTNMKPKTDVKERNDPSLFCYYSLQSLAASTSRTQKFYTMCENGCIIAFGFCASVCCICNKKFDVFVNKL